MIQLEFFILFAMSSICMMAYASGQDGNNDMFNLWGLKDLFTYGDPLDLNTIVNSCSTSSSNSSNQRPNNKAFPIGARVFKRKRNTRTGLYKALAPSTENIDDLERKILDLHKKTFPWAVLRVECMDYKKWVDVCDSVKKHATGQHLSYKCKAVKMISKEYRLCFRSNECTQLEGDFLGCFCKKQPFFIMQYDEKKYALLQANKFYNNRESDLYIHDEVFIQEMLSD